ncbi:NPL4 family protein [Cardiosporidium cionae]|uniref:NPL4 family protein n=1 Tax=Cardiosporidium cionae TaxID=476202 RepID=A0ABQ7J8D1_9APIC|nr:NPL4 family protein [Cardiosporidium cionae]|eukprot:KAF8820252.1 NPL4 family protein [Cardiosporidium cionae]
MSPPTLILRIRSPAGFTRLSISSSLTLKDLKKEIEVHTNIPAEQQSLFLDADYRKSLSGDSCFLDKFALQNGSILFVKSDYVGEIKGSTLESTQGKWKTSTELTEQHPKDTTKKNMGKPLPHSQGIDDMQPEDKSLDSSASEMKTSLPKISAEDTSAGFRKDDKSEPNFKSFDQFLTDNGYNIIELPGSKSYLPSQLVRNQMMKVPPSVTLKYQPYRHVDHLELMNVEEIKNFVNYWRYSLDMVTQRAGWMFGYYKEDEHYPLGIRAVCEAIYEPPQYSVNDSICLLDDPDNKKVEAIAAHLGLEKIGMIFTHLPRDEFLTAKEVISIANRQLNSLTNKHFTGYLMSKLVTCTISPDLTANGEPVANAFMVSDMGMALVRDGLINEELSNGSHMHLRKAKKQELLPQILESGKEAVKFDSDWFLVRVNESAPKRVRSMFLHTHFPRENRDTPCPSSAIKDYFSHPAVMQYKKESRWKRFADFHLILYVSIKLDLETALTICESIRDQSEVDEGLEEVLSLLA